ncbi:hypothetical protein D3C76_827540 [compost metagenome]|uniref:Uncharacterized protein n=1 Tax=Pseudomonas fluorescens TaxID=294 RepID=A0A5E6PIB3_PSEFL|nr:hypothetical protein [Pseudomonas fluorescens]VVM42417.1 hypothetical protein PS659_00343 [Pseudomonas fluorescens]
MDTTLNDVRRSAGSPQGLDAAVIENTLLAYFAGLSREDKQYIKNSMRWAESRADLHHDREQSPAKWFEFYSGVLWSAGWSLEHQPVIVIDNHHTGSLVDTWSKALSTQVSRAKLSLIRQTFGQLEHDRPALELLTSSARQSRDFRFLPAEYNRAGELEILVTNVRLLSSSWSTRLLFWEVEQPQTQLDIRVRRFAIKSREMNKYRESLNEAVKEMRLREIALTT